MKKLACSLLTIIILFTISCEIGLGSSVDTDPPSLDIDPAIVSKVIADDFDIETSTLKEPIQTTEQFVIYMLFSNEPTVTVQR